MVYVFEIHYCCLNFVPALFLSLILGLLPRALANIMPPFISLPPIHHNGIEGMIVQVLLKVHIEFQHH